MDSKCVVKLEGDYLSYNLDLCIKDEPPDDNVIDYNPIAKFRDRTAPKAYCRTRILHKIEDFSSDNHSDYVVFKNHYSAKEDEFNKNHFPINPFRKQWKNVAGNLPSAVNSDEIINSVVNDSKLHIADKKKSKKSGRPKKSKSIETGISPDFCVNQEFDRECSLEEKSKNIDNDKNSATSLSFTRRRRSRRYRPVDPFADMPDIGFGKLPSVKRECEDDNATTTLSDDVKIVDVIKPAKKRRIARSQSKPTVSVDESPNTRKPDIITKSECNLIDETEIEINRRRDKERNGGVELTSDCYGHTTDNVAEYSTINDDDNNSEHFQSFYSATSNSKRYWPGTESFNRNEFYTTAKKKKEDYSKILKRDVFVTVDPTTVSFPTTNANSKGINSSFVSKGNLPKYQSDHSFFRIPHSSPQDCSFSSPIPPPRFREFANVSVKTEERYNEVAEPFKHDYFKKSSETDDGLSTEEIDRILNNQPTLVLRDCCAVYENKSPTLPPCPKQAALRSLNFADKTKCIARILAENDAKHSYCGDNALRHSLRFSHSVKKTKAAHPPDVLLPRHFKEIPKFVLQLWDLINDQSESYRRSITWIKANLNETENVATSSSVTNSLLSPKELHCEKNVLFGVPSSKLGLTNLHSRIQKNENNSALKEHPEILPSPPFVVDEIRQIQALPIKKPDNLSIAETEHVVDRRDFNNSELSGKEILNILNNQPIVVLHRIPTEMLPPPEGEFEDDNFSKEQFNREIPKKEKIKNFLFCCICSQWIQQRPHNRTVNHVIKHFSQTNQSVWFYECMLCGDYGTCYAELLRSHMRNFHGKLFELCEKDIDYVDVKSNYSTELDAIRSEAFSRQPPGGACVVERVAPGPPSVVPIGRHELSSRLSSSSCAVVTTKSRRRKSNDSLQVSRDFQTSCTQVMSDAVACELRDFDSIAVGKDGNAKSPDCQKSKIQTILDTVVKRGTSNGYTRYDLAAIDRMSNTNVSRDVDVKRERSVDATTANFRKRNSQSPLRAAVDVVVKRQKLNASRDLKRNDRVICRLCDVDLQRANIRSHLPTHLPEIADITWLYRCLICSQLKRVRDFQTLHWSSLRNHLRFTHKKEYCLAKKGVHYIDRSDLFRVELRRVCSLAFPK